MYTTRPGVDLRALEKVKDAISWLIRRATLCGLALLDNYVELVDTDDPRFAKQLPAFPFMATDYKHIFYNPRWVNEATIEDVGFILMHEWLHIFLRHDARLGAREHLRWNYAGDYKINALVATALERPIPDYLLIPTAAMLPLEAEAIYDMLPSNPSGLTADMLEPVGDAATREQAVREMAERCALFLGDREPLGKLDASWVNERLSLLRRVFLPWDMIWVAQVSRDLGYAIPTYTRPKKHYLPYVFAPRMLDKRVKNAMVAIDISGSVGEHDIERFAYVLQQVALKASSLTVVTFDDSIRETIVTTNPSNILKHIKFAQGAHRSTDVRPVFELAAKVKPKSLTVVTDGHVTYPDTPHPYTNWILTKGHRLPPWGRMFRMSYTQ